MSDDASPPSPEPTPRPRAGVGPLVAITTIGVLLFVASLGLVFFYAGSVDLGTVEDDSILVVKLDASVQDAPQMGGILDPENFPATTSEIAAAIRNAADDSRIRGIWLRLDAPALGWAGTQEVRAALVALQEAGKPCVAYSESYASDTYLLASGCGTVVLTPAGVGMVNGIASSTTYFAELFGKLGVEPEFEHVGDFKSAVEPYERTEPSEAASEATNALLDSLWTQWVDQVAAGRQVEPDTLRAWVDDVAMSPSAALERGLVDALAYPDQIRRHLATLGDEGWAATLADDDAETTEIELTSVDEYLKGIRASWGNAPRHVAVIHASGSIVSGEADGGLFGSQVVADRTMARWLREAREDSRVVGLVLRVESPGGSGLASDLIWREIRRFQATDRPVVVSMANTAASGGYYIAAPADYIFAQPGTLTGSIGVFGGKFSLAEAYEKVGVSQTTYKRGELADLFSITEPFSDEGREVYRTFLQDFYDRFLDVVAEGRGLERDAVHAVAQGRVWTGEQALERQLVDELGGLDDAFEKVVELAGVESAGRLRWPKRKGFLELLLEDLERQDDPMVALHALAGTPLLPLSNRELQELFVLNRVFEDGGAVAILPGSPEITSR